jgi:hypothetical protein
MRENPGFPPGGYSYAADLKWPFFEGFPSAPPGVSVETIWVSNGGAGTVVWKPAGG